MIRLDKLLSHSGYGTRKEVKKLIRNNQVSVDGVIIKNDDYKVDETKSIIKVMEETIEYQEYIYIMMNKPKGYVCANYDNYQDTVFELIPEYYYLDLACVGRLDIDTTGLLLITNDGVFNHNVTKPKKTIEKVYIAEVNGKIKDEDFKIFAKGVIIDGDYKCLPAKLELIEENENTSIVSVTVMEGKYHQVKRMFHAIGLKVMELKRIRIGNLELDKRLELGDYRLLTDEEVKNIF